MSSSVAKLMVSRFLWVRTLILLTWALFVAAVIIFHEQHIFPTSQIIDVAGLLGFGVAIVWVLLAGRWKYACIFASAVLVVLYVVRWILLVEYIYSGNPELGVTTAIERLMHLWVSEFSWNAENFGLGHALLAVYWNLVMALAQGLVVVAMWWFFWRARLKTDSG
jgi:hypothetical protein